MIIKVFDNYNDDKNDAQNKDNKKHQNIFTKYSLCK